MCKLFRSIDYVWIWTLVSLLVLLLCLDIEFKWLLIPCSSCKLASVVNKVILSLSYSYIAATIFHLIVNVIPHRKRKKNITPFLRTQLWGIEDRLRLCKETVLPIFDLNNNEYTRKEYIKLFSNANLYEKAVLGNGFSKLDQLNNLRSKIIDSVNVVLAYREYIDDELFGVLNDVLKSSFIKDGIDPYPDIDSNVRYEYNSNQSEIGESIYDLYIKIKIVNQQY